MMKAIPLTQGYDAIVDDEDYDSLSGFKWFACVYTNGVYAMRGRRISEPGTQKHIRMHRQIMNAPDGMLVDHINRNPLDNRRENLRLVTLAQNNRNKRALGTFKGTRTYLDGWRAELRTNGRMFRGPPRKTQAQAARDYDLLAIEHHGEFAYLNFPDGSEFDV